MNHHWFADALGVTRTADARKMLERRRAPVRMHYAVEHGRCGMPDKEAIGRAKKAARTKGAKGRSAEARKAARTRAKKRK